MVSSLSVYYRKLAYHVIESDGFLWVGFKPGMVHFIAKEVWNIRPLTRTDVERYYEEFTVLTQGKGSLYFRIVATEIGHRNIGISIVTDHQFSGLWNAVSNTPTCGTVGINLDIASIPAMLTGLCNGAIS